MKKTTKLIIRIVGAVLVILAGITLLLGYKDEIINGLEFAGTTLIVAGAYLLFASEDQLLSWKLDLSEFEEETED